MGPARLFTAGVAVFLALAGSVHAQQAPFDPVGRWRAYHTDGTSFLIRLTKDQAATTNYGDGERGIWRVEGNAVRVVYTDGWDDLLSKNADGGFRKRGWQPGADRCAAAQNDGKAEHISSDPGPPL